MRKLFRLSVAGLVALGLALPAAVWAQSAATVYSPVVAELMHLAVIVPEIGYQLDHTLESQEETSFWHGKTKWDLYDFLDQWLVFLPTPDNARTYMDRFYELAGASPGRDLVLIPEFTAWLAEFMEARGRFMDSPASAAALPAWLEDPAINLSDYLVPPGGFQSFNHFFTRRIRPEVRPISGSGDASVLTSPADSTLIPISQQISAKTVFEVKGDRLHLSELLGGSPLAERFMGGQAVLCMLGTTDYHHFHAPVGGSVLAAEQLAGLYYGMDTGWVDSFFQHRRGYYIFETERFGCVGMVCVGMFTISSIEFRRAAGEVVTKGEELGHFAYGGSAIILLFEPDRAEITLPLDQHMVKVRMGQQIGVSLP